MDEHTAQPTSRRTLLGSAIGAAGALLLQPAATLAGVEAPEEEGEPELAALVAYPWRTNNGFNVSGLAIIRAGKRRTSVDLSFMYDPSFLQQPHMSGYTVVTLTPRGDIGTRRLWYATDPAHNRLIIKVSRPVPGDLAVAWAFVDAALGGVYPA